MPKGAITKVLVALDWHCHSRPQYLREDLASYLLW